MPDREWEFYVPFLGMLLLYFLLPAFEVIVIWLVAWTAVKVFFLAERLERRAAAQMVA